MGTAQKQKGFTITEVVLFLAISGLFFLIAFFGIRGRTDVVQFSDSLRTFENFAQQQVALVQNGAFPTESKTTCPYGQGACVYLGRIMEFTIDSTDVTVYTLIGNQPIGGPKAQTLADLAPAVLAGSSEQFTFEWGVTLREAELQQIAGAPYRPGGPGTRVFIGFVRNPADGQVFPIGYADQSGLPAEQVLGNPTAYNAPSSVSTLEAGLGVNFQGSLCMTNFNRSRIAAVDFGVDRQNEAIGVEFDRCIQLGILSP